MSAARRSRLRAPALATVAVAASAVAAVAVLAIAAGAGPLAAQESPMAAVDIEERPGARVPADVPVVAAGGAPSRLADHVEGDAPVVLALVYYRCRMLCGLVLDGLARGFGDSPLVAGRDYRVVALGIDPREEPADAARRGAALARAQGAGAERDAPPGWTLLLPTSRAAVDRVAGAVGFHYRYDPDTDQFAHAAAAFVLTPEGRVAEVLYGTRFGPAELEAAVAAAAAGEVAGVPEGEATGALERAVLRCFRYTPALRRYAGLVANLLRGGGALIVLGVLSLVGLSLRSELRRREAGG